MSVSVIVPPVAVGEGAVCPLLLTENTTLVINESPLALIVTPLLFFKYHRLFEVLPSSIFAVKDVPSMVNGYDLDGKLPDDNLSLL